MTRISASQSGHSARAAGGAIAPSDAGFDRVAQHQENRAVLRGRPFSLCRGLWQGHGFAQKGIAFGEHVGPRIGIVQLVIQALEFDQLDWLAR